MSFMTSIVSLLAGPFVQMAADRLVTVRRGSGPNARTDVHDDEANKSIVLVTRDAAAAIGYTGIAYLNKKPTDVFLADHFAGRAPAGRTGVEQTVGGHPLPQLGKSVVTLLRSLEVADAQLTDKALAPA